MNKLSLKLVETVSISFHIWRNAADGARGYDRRACLNFSETFPKLLISVSLLSSSAFAEAVCSLRPTRLNFDRGYWRPSAVLLLADLIKVERYYCVRPAMNAARLAPTVCPGAWSNVSRRSGDRLASIFLYASSAPSGRVWAIP